MVAVLFTNLFDNMTVVTGYSFRAYFHAAAMGPKLWYVPATTGPIFAVAGYITWVLAGILLGIFFENRAVIFGRAIVEASLTTSWDLCVDAIGGTEYREWSWVDGGTWLGVPLR